MTPIFARPEGIVTPSSEAAFIALLERHRVPISKWEKSDKKLEELWKEIKNRDAVYTAHRTDYVKQPRLVRFIITVAARVTTSLPRIGRASLVQYFQEADTFRPRRHTDTSLSEKTKLTVDGIPAETPDETIARCLEEEVRLHVAHASVKRRMHFMEWLEKNAPEWHDSDRQRGLFPYPGSMHIETDFHEKKKRMPGLWHANQIARYAVELPSRHYFLGLRMDDTNRYLSHWSSTHEPSTQFDPIPAELVLSVKKASA